MGTRAAAHVRNVKRMKCCRRHRCWCCGGVVTLAVLLVLAADLLLVHYSRADAAWHAAASAPFREASLSESRARPTGKKSLPSSYRVLDRGVGRRVVAGF